MIREEWLLKMIAALRPDFERIGFCLPEKIRASCSWPSKSALAEKKKRIGEAWSAECSGDEHYETFISPVLKNPIDVGATLVHELCHCAAGLGQVKQSLLPKADRSLSGRQTAVIYRAGVFVREIEDTDETSVYDYNFKPSELPIDECRNSSDYAIKAAISRLYRRATSQELVPVMEAMVAQKPVYEEHLDPYYVIPSWEEPKEEQKKNWQQAWKAVAADAVLCGPSSAIVEFVERKGYKAQPVRSVSFVGVAERFGIRTASKVLTTNEKNGREKLPPTEAARAGVDEVWGWLTTYNLANGIEKPPVGCFRDVMDAGSRTMGFCDDEGVYIADDQASDRSKPLLKTALEECIHWITKATDGSRDLQDFAFRMIVEILA